MSEILGGCFLVLEWGRGERASDVCDITQKPIIL